MKAITQLSVCFTLVLTTSAYAVDTYNKVTTDGSMGQAVSIPIIKGVPTVQQNLGMTTYDSSGVPVNLFHSFSTFSIDAGDTVKFTGDAGLKNVISRVTGNNVSYIYGTLKSEIPNANFYFINPAGITFGADAKVDVPAAFHVSTADKVVFADGHFDANTLPVDSSVLTSAPPEAFGFLGTNNNGEIQINGTQLNPNYTNLKTGQKVDFVAGSITINNNAKISALSGEIRLVAINGNETVSLIRDSDNNLPLPTQAPSLTNAGKIILNNSIKDIGNLDTTSDGGGRIALWGGKISFINSSAFADNTGNTDATAGKNVEIHAHSLDVKDQSHISFDALGGEGKAGNVIVNVTKALNIFNNGFIKSTTYGNGNAGDVSVTANTLKIDRQTPESGITGIFSEATLGLDSQGQIAKGNSGNVTVQAKTIEILNGGVIKSSTIAPGNAGNVKVTAKNSLIINNGNSPVLGGIYSLNEDRGYGSGNSGNVTVTTGNLDILNGGVIYSSTHGQGHAGKVKVRADILNIDGQGFLGGKTGIFSEANSLSSENSRAAAGKIDVTATKTISIFNGGQISSSSVRSSPANEVSLGSVSVKADSLTIDSQGFSKWNTGILSESGEKSAVGAGAITVDVTKNLDIFNGGVISNSSASKSPSNDVIVNADTINIDGKASLKETGIFSQASGHIGTNLNDNFAGNITINANSKLSLSNNGKISIANLGSSDDPASVYPSAITIAAPNIDMKNSSITTESTGNVDAGKVNINFSHWLTMDPSYITTTGNIGNGGTININGGELIYLQNSGFLTSVGGANSNGGNINVIAKALVMETGIIQANAKGGSGGDINLNLRTLIPGQNRLILGGQKIDWQPYQSGLNVIQAVSETGVSGTINVTSPQFDISGSITGLSTNSLTLPDIGNNPCHTEVASMSSLTRGGKGGIPLDESGTSFIPPVIPKATLDTSLNSDLQSSQALSATAVNLKEKYPCATE